MSAVRYYLMGSGSLHSNIARVHGHEFSYLDHETGDWVPHPAVFDSVTFEPDTVPISLAEAKRKAKLIVPTLEPVWIDDGEIVAIGSKSEGAT